MPLDISFVDVLDILLFEYNPANAPIDAVATAARVYCATGRLFTPEFIMSRYIDTLRRLGGRDKGEVTLAPIRNRFFEEIMVQREQRQNSTTSIHPHHMMPHNSNHSNNNHNNNSTTQQHPTHHVPAPTVVDSQSLIACLDRCCTDRGSEIFQDPVDPNVYMTYNRSCLGPYSTVVLHPMHLMSIRHRIESGAINTWDTLLADLLLITANCVFFNAPEGEFPHTARQFCVHFTKCVEE
eukprot:PhF_6_TR43540/c0_g2_i2/m.66846